MPAADSLMSLAQVLAQQETAISDARISQLSECKFLSEQEVIELAAKCKVSPTTVLLLLGADR